MLVPCRTYTKHGSAARTSHRLKKTSNIEKQPELPQTGSVVHKRESSGIQSVERAIGIVDIITKYPDGIALAQLSAELGLNNTTVFNLVKTLDALDIVTQIPETKRYRIGSHLFTLAAGALNETTLLSLAEPILEKLSKDTGEAANLAVRSQAEIVVIARTAATGMLQLASRAGTTRPIHVTATGKALLSTLAIDELNRLLESCTLQAYTDNSITSRKALVKELDSVRKTGLAYDRCEFDADVTCAAAVVNDFAGRNVAAIGISGPVWRMTPKLLQTKTKNLLAAANDLSALLGNQQIKSSEKVKTVNATK